MPKGKAKGPTYDSAELAKGRDLYEEMENNLIYQYFQILSPNI